MLRLAGAAKLHCIVSSEEPASGQKIFKLIYRRADNDLNQPHQQAVFLKPFLCVLSTTFLRKIGSFQSRSTTNAQDLTIEEEGSLSFLAHTSWRRCTKLPLSEKISPNIPISTFDLENNSQ
jgi:hypothetical protein